MNTPAFWFSKPSFLQNVLSHALMPIGEVYRLVGILRLTLTIPYRARIPVICLGNIVAGGSGKTPTAIAIAALLQKNGQRPVFVSRGHGGREKGPLRVDPAQHTAADVGDEPLLLARTAPVYIARHRASAIRAAEADALNPTHIILDDGLQNPTFVASTSLLVIDAATGFGNGRLIPAGPLRERYTDVRSRINGVVIIGDGQPPLPETDGLPQYRAALAPQTVTIKAERYLAFAGIGHPDKFYRTCRASGLNIVATQSFADHHPYNRAILEKLLQTAQSLNATLLTTEKDMARIPADLHGQIATLGVHLSFKDDVVRLLHTLA
ncbi:MAG: tetraacyldisaccharide 4'-kinase [Alphaproteobacteria bacterium]|nr:tetraacyldisaccharide 4'-kinase [Alphaproteobacteria bacterium]